ncbi:Digeranylgeranylglycerophospholipid reductase [uncultured archaeon]|nr:Digeranylgeranylglycerophospholipid reductase [uncultured archaeon]
MPKKAYDVVIVGGGPSGSTCAALLGEAGISTLLLDKGRFPRDKICGDALSGKSLRLLTKLGLVDAVVASPHGTVTGMYITAPNGKGLTVPFNYTPAKDEVGVKSSNEFYTCRRMVYDSLLFENAKKKVDVIEGFEVTGLVKDGNVVKGVVGRGPGGQASFSANVVVGADGYNSVVGREMGLRNADLKHVIAATRQYFSGVSGLSGNIELHFVDEALPGYFWIFPLEDGKANVGVGMTQASMQKKKVNLKKLHEEMVGHPRFAGRFKDAKPLTGVQGWNLPSGSTRIKNYGSGFVIVGDAASLVDPFSGEGIGNAMLSGYYAARTIEEAVKSKDFSEKTLAKYDADLWCEIGGEMRNSYMMQRICNITFLLNLVVSKANKRPEVAHQITSALSDDARSKLTSPLFFLKLLLT